MLSDEKLIEQVREDVKESLAGIAKWREKARQAFSYASGDQWADADREKLANESRPVITYNRITAMVEAVSGAERGNRQELRFKPRTAEDSGVAEVLDGLSEWARDYCTAEDEESDAFTDVIKCGMGWTETLMDYDEDQDGKVIIERLNPLETFWDTTAKKRNLADSRFRGYIKKLSRHRLEDMFPDAEHAFVEGVLGADSADELESQQRSGDAKPLVSLLHYQYATTVPVYRVAVNDPDNPENIEFKEFSQEEFTALEESLKAADMPPPVNYKDTGGALVPSAYIKGRRKKYYRAYFNGEHLLKHAEIPAPDFTLQCITGRMDVMKREWTGVVADLIEPQNMMNKVLSQFVYMFSVNPKGGLLAERGAFENPADAEKNWARPDTIIHLQQNGLSKIKERQVAGYPPVLDRLLEVTISSFPAVSGLNFELMGITSRDQPGVLEMQRKQAGLTILATFFDSLRYYRKLHGRVLAAYLTRFIDPDRALRILGGKVNLQAVQAAAAADVMAYDIVVDDAPTSPNQKEMVLAVIMQLFQYDKEIGRTLLPEFIEHTPLPTAIVDRLRKAIQAQSAPNPDAEKAKQLAEAKVQAETAEKMSKAHLNMAKAGTEGEKVDIQEMQAITNIARGNAGGY